ncbi:MAG TPA: hypothetical protein VD948_12635 [Rhodothermales bacterium]|nr:hypothetical protein [Rhodothermales bacterium]
MGRQRRGMWIKNTNERSVELVLGTRTIRLEPGDETAVTPDEVRDPNMREHLQVRTVVIVRPTTPEEEETLTAELGNG